jgi:hypothetical protein
MNTQIEIELLKQENLRLWNENNTLRPLVSDLRHRLSIALKGLQDLAYAETDIIEKKE